VRRTIVIALSLAGLCLVVLLGRETPARAAGSTLECGNLPNAVWSLAGSPYLVCSAGATVPATATLTLQPGVTVQFSPTASLAVAGSLQAIGTATQPITFTGVTASAGSWHGLTIDHSLVAPASADLEFTTMDFGGISGTSKAEIYVDRGVLTLTHSLVRSSAGSGLHATTSALVNVSDTGFVNNAQDAVRLIDPRGDLQFSDLTASGNLTDAVHILGLNTAIRGAHRWSYPGLPYVIDVLMGNQYGDVLTIDPGNELRFGLNDGLGIGGELIAAGQANLLPLPRKPRPPGSGAACKSTAMACTPRPRSSWTMRRWNMGAAISEAPILPCTTLYSPCTTASSA
jgi:hypothetical protein